jgi:hypothetical protein
MNFIRVLEVRTLLGTEVKGGAKGRLKDRREGQSDWPEHRPLTE